MPEGFSSTDPAPLTHVDWAATGNILTNLWFILGFVILFAMCMLAAHIFIPSLLASGHIPHGLRNFARKQRIPAYFTAIIMVGMIAYWYSQATDTAHELRAFWTRFWI